MKLNQLLLAAALLFTLNTFAQDDHPILFRSGTINPQPNLTPTFIDSFNTYSFKGKTLVVLQFEKLPTADDRKVLESTGVTLLDHIPQRAYTALVTRPLQRPVLLDAGVRAVLQLEPGQKMDANLSRGTIPHWAVKSPGTVDVWFSFPKGFSTQEVLDSLKRDGIQLLSLNYQRYGVLAVRISTGSVFALAQKQYVAFLQAAPAGDQPLNSNSMAGSRANVLNVSAAHGGRGLDGKGVVVGVGDNADVQTHADFAGRLINRAPVGAAGHGHHVTGTVGGAGNINELFRGYAPKATIISQAFSGILVNAPLYVQDHGMVITNNSFGDIIECDYHGTYDLMSRIMDQMAFELPTLSNVFAAGNSGGTICPPFTNSYRTVLGGYQSAKNVITVGATTDSGMLGGFSSRGPVRDGRTKPEIVAMGQRVASTWPTNIYSYNNGTSMAAPAVSGGLALLYQRYRQLNGGSDPKNALMKALLCNGASDRGNTGPDYQYGFGWMNLLRSVEMMEGVRYFQAAAQQGGNSQHTITVPAGTAQLKVLLYWNDPAASLISARTLVNDLDLQVVDAAATTHLPRILDSSAAGAATVAVTGVDRKNNMEQVIIDNPAAGTYTLRVSGAGIAQNPSQDYVLVYDMLPQGIRITSPAAAEGLVPGELAKISWDTYGLNGTANIEFSADNGSTWTLVAGSIDVNRATFSWFVPTVATDKGRIRITPASGQPAVTSDAFTIITPPAVSLAAVQCEGYITINWNSISGATDYEVMQLVGEEMKTIAAVTGTTYSIPGLSKDSVYWVTVRARVNGKGGRRSIAVARQPNSGSCAGSVSDNDLKLDAIVAPLTGRRLTSTQLSAASVVTVRIKNLDDAPVSAFAVSYSLNGGNWVTENVSAPLPAGATYTHNFSAPVDLATAGSYTLRTAVTNMVADGVRSNDTLVSLVRHLDNQPLVLSTPFIDNMEGAAVQTQLRDVVGLEGLHRYDLTRSASVGRLRTFVNTGIAYSGSKAITVDADRVFSAGNTNYLYGTFNLSNYSAAANDIRLDFRWLSHSNEANAANRVWIRGNDGQPWIEVFDLQANAADAGLYQKSASIELSDLLSAAGQGFGTSFQVRWGQWGRMPATDKEIASGFSFDDLRLYEVVNDLQLKAVESPASTSCALGATTPVTVSLRNSANQQINAVPVRYRVNGGAWVSETIASIAANTTITYTFSQAANMSALGQYTIQAVVDLPADSYRENDTVTVSIRNVPVISGYPYLQSFELSDGSWYTGGKRSSWEWGSPASQKISKAANGSKAWKTRLAGSHTENELSYLYSPCFDVSALAKPMLSFSLALDIEDCGTTLCDGAWMEYSADGNTWTRLGTAGSGYNWYNKATDRLWSRQNHTTWRVATTSLPAGLNRLRLRFVFSSDPGVNREGIAVDDIHIYDSIAPVYDGPTVVTPVSNTVSGTGWVHFTSGNKLMASVRADNQVMGATAVQSYLFNGAVRYSNGQYYHNRNITVKAANRSLSDSVTIRFYFPDSEVDSLLVATGCASCTRPASAYELGISKYSDPDPSFENGTIADNQQGTWSFIPLSGRTIVPFEKGYYAEFRVKDLSEFWLNNGGTDRNAPLPVKMMDFTAQRSTGTDVLLQWKVAAESNVSRYEVELARGAAAMQAGQFAKTGEVASQGNTTSVRNYTYTDVEAEKFGTRYYRLKIINGDGSFHYSAIRMVAFDDAVLWQVYPNPSSGVFSLLFQANTGEVVRARLVDAKGRVLKQVEMTGTGQPQKLPMDISASSFASGVYLLQVSVGGKEQSFKVNKL